MRGNRPVSSHGSDQLISSPDNDVVRRLRRLAHRREPGLVLLEGPRVLAEAKAAGLEFELLVVREGDKLPFHSESRVTLTAGAYRAATQTVTPQGVMAIARLRESVAADAIRAARNARWPLLVLDGVQDPGTAGRGVDRVSGHDRARQRSARPLAQGPHAGDRAADRRRRVAERRRCCGVDPVRDQASESGMTDASSLTTEALAAIGRAPSEDD